MHVFFSLRPEQQMRGELASDNGKQWSCKENPLHSLRTPGEVVRRHYYAKPKGETHSCREYVIEAIAREGRVSAWTLVAS